MQRNAIQDSAPAKLETGISRAQAPHTHGTTRAHESQPLDCHSIEELAVISREKSWPCLCDEGRHGCRPRDSPLHIPTRPIHTDLKFNQKMMHNFALHCTTRCVTHWTTLGGHSRELIDPRPFLFLPVAVGQHCRWNLTSSWAAQAYLLFAKPASRSLPAYAPLHAPHWDQVPMSSWPDQPSAGHLVALAMQLLRVLGLQWSATRRVHPPVD